MNAAEKQPKTHLTKEDREFYINGRQDRCPYCDSKEVDFDSSTHEGTHHEQRAFCVDCDRNWLLIYDLTTIQEMN